jgi:hypothetical protein
MRRAMDLKANSRELEAAVLISTGFSEEQFGTPKGVSYLSIKGRMSKDSRSAPTN